MDERHWARSSAVCLRLLRNQNIYQHCSLCSFFQEQQSDQCQHQPSTPKKLISRTATPFTECSFYTAADGSTPKHHDDETSSLSSRSSSSTLVASVQLETTELIKPRPELRRKWSPTHCSLRELNRKHSSYASCYSRRRPSERQLQHTYESQIMAYLNGGAANLHTWKG